jgi:hypothetical protein
MGIITGYHNNVILLPEIEKNGRLKTVNSAGQHVRLSAIQIYVTRVTVPLDLNICVFIKGIASQTLQFGVEEFLLFC